MQIYDTKLKAMRDMTPEEEEIANNMPNPEKMPHMNEEPNSKNKGEIKCIT